MSDYEKMVSDARAVGVAVGETVNKLIEEIDILCGRLAEANIKIELLKAQPVAAAALDGFRLVPIEPTEEMREAANDVDSWWTGNPWSSDLFMEVYRRMVGVAPAPGKPAATSWTDSIRELKDHEIGG